MKCTIGIPAYNEEKNIASIITKLKKITDSIIVCDDGSNDLTKEISEIVFNSEYRNSGRSDELLLERWQLRFLLNL